MTVMVHLTPLAPRIPPAASLSDPCRWTSYHGSTPVQAIKQLAVRLERSPLALAFRQPPQTGDIDVFDIREPRRVLAIFTEGVTLDQVTDALAELKRRGGR